MRSIESRQSSISASHESVATYLNEIGRYATLTREEEVVLAQRIRQGDAGALTELVRANLRFVVLMARKYQNRGVALVDLIGEGNYGLVLAAERFDERRGVKFITYAVWWVKQAISRALAEQGHTVRVPPAQANALYRASRRAAALAQTLQREPSQQELQKDMGWSDAELLTAMATARPPLSLDADFNEDNHASLHSCLEDQQSAHEERASDIDDMLRSAMASLRKREAEILAMYFGLNGAEPMTLEEIALAMGITRERIRQIKLKALSRLKKSAQLQALAS